MAVGRCTVNVAPAPGVLSIVKSYAAVKGPIGGANPSMVNLLPPAEELDVEEE